MLIDDWSLIKWALNTNTTVLACIIDRQTWNQNTNSTNNNQEKIHSITWLMYNLLFAYQ